MCFGPQVYARLVLRRLPQPQPTIKILLQAHDSIVQLQKSILFENLFMAVVAFDTVALVSEYSTMPAMYTSVMSVVHIVTAALFLLELIVNILACGIQLYVSDNSKKFDFAVVVLTTVDGLMSLEALLSGRSGSQPLRSVRVLRSLRVLHVLKFFRCVL